MSTPELGERRRKILNTMKIYCLLLIILTLVSCKTNWEKEQERLKKERVQKSMEALDETLKEHGAPLYKDLHITEFLNELYGYGFSSSKTIGFNWSSITNDYIKTEEATTTTNFYFTNNSLAVQTEGFGWMKAKLSFSNFDSEQQQYTLKWNDNELVIIPKDKSKIFFYFNFDNVHYKNVTIFLNCERNNTINSSSIF